LKFDGRFNKRQMIFLCAFLVTAVLAVQLVAVTAWTADNANAGPGIVILQLSGDDDTNWAVADLQSRLSKFITDDPFFVDRVVVRRTNDPRVAETLGGQIVVYMSHGGPLGIVTGKHITSWHTMAGIISQSSAVMHLFAACYSRNIIRLGSKDSGKKLYAVPQARPAEVTNVEITATIMLALGMDSSAVEEYRTGELTKAKGFIETGNKIHMMDFEQVILSEADYIDEHYSDTYTTYYRTEQCSESSALSGWSGFERLPADLQNLILQYYATAWDNAGNSFDRTFISCDMTYVRNYYYDTWWVEDETPPPEEPNPPPGEPGNPGDPYSTPDSETSPIYVEAQIYTGGHWEIGDYVFTSNSYSGVVTFQGDGLPYQQIVVNVTASGTTLGAVDSICLVQDEADGLYVQRQKIDGTWQEPVVGRNTERTGGAWSDPAVEANYEYDSAWPELPYLDASVKENAEDGDTAGWFVYDTTPAGQISNVYDFGDRCIKLLGGGTSTGYEFPTVSWDDTVHKTIRWSMRYSESYTICISVDTTAGHRYIYYTNANSDYLGATPGYVHHGLGTWTTDNKWHSFERNLVSDLHDAEPSVNIIDVNAILIRGSGKIDDIMLLNTEYETSGTIQSNGEYISVNSIPTGTGWHGPSFVSTLPSVFKIEDMGAFSANLSLVHSNDGTRMSATAVSLFDTNKKIAASLLIYDGLGYTSGPDAQKQYFSATYYHSDGNSKTASSGIISGDTSGVVTIRYDPLQGIFAEVSGSSEILLFTHTEIEKARLIKYVAIQSYRYGSYTEHDERIYSISLSYAGSEYTVFHESCSDMNDFHKDLNFGYGTVTNGTIEVPDGQSFTTLTSIETGTGWHGPSYVYELDRPFRLYQLADFSVLTGLTQGTAAAMGKTVIGLFDESKEPIMTIDWADSGNYVDGYLKASFFAQSGTEYERYLWYGDTSMQTGVQLWWDNPSDGYGEIYVHSDVAPYDYLLGSCYNVSRVVEYVVIIGQGYGSNPLLDMRIHDIEVTANPNSRAPPFIDDCNNNGYFPLDNSFPWGPTTSGVLSVGSSYLYPSGIPNSPTGWHGPDFVHVLSNPFELQDLSEFSVEGELVQHSSFEMGKLQVALVDENMQVALMVYWCDAWAGMTQGYFHVAYYPLGASAHYDTTGYTSSSIHRTGKLWVHDGNMQYEIPGYDSGNMGAVTDPHRVIKYIVIRPERYSSYTLCDLRLHHITVSEGLPTQLPTEQVEADGTTKATESSGKHTNAYIVAMQESENIVHTWWDAPNFWPLLHMMASFAIGEVPFILHFTVDLLGTFNALQQEGGPVLEDELDQWLIVFSAVGLVTAGIQVGIGMLAVCEFFYFSPDPVSKSLLAAAIITLIGSVAAGVWFTETRVQEGVWNRVNAFGFYFTMFIQMLRYLFGLRGVKGIISTAVIGALMIHWGSTLENMMSCIEEMAKPMKFTKLVILSLAVFFGIIAGIHYAYLRGWI
jgi:hypothetical protein